MGILEYFIPTKLRVAIFVALVFLANVPYVGTSVNGKSQCMQSYCNPVTDPSCTPERQCYTEFQSTPHWLFWWPYPPFTLSYQNVEFSAEAVPLVVIQRKPELFHQTELLETLAYWYAIALLITIPWGKEEDEVDVLENDKRKKWYQRSVKTPPIS